MSQTRALSGTILGPTGWLAGRVVFGEHIEKVEGESVPGVDVGESRSRGAEHFILPGFVDLHVHGGGGADVMDGGTAVRAVAQSHAAHGTTALLATTMTAPRAELEALLAGLGRACEDRVAAGARILGVHLEGPYINPGKLGAQPNFARPAALEELSHYCRSAPIRLVTLAPETAGHLEVIRTLAAEGIRVQIGHTLGSYEDGVAALAHGATGFTHLFNAMTGVHHRRPGIAGAALAHAEYAELIPDLHHVHPGAMRVALRAIPRLYCVTDASAAAGMPDGDYRLGPNSVTKCLGGVRLADGTLAGSCLTMDRALRNLVGIGLALADASHRLSLYPAEYLGLTDRGRVEVGAYADLVVLDRDLQVVSVVGEGESLWPR